MTKLIGINTFSVFQAFFDDYLGTLETLAKMGYKQIELLSVNFLNDVRFSDIYPALELKSKFTAMGITPIAVHERLEQGKNLLEYDWDSIIKYNYELGCEAIVIPWLWFNNLDETLQTAEHMNAIGKRFKENGLQLYYHNHGHEFRKTGDRTFFDVLVENTDPNHLKFELDLIWIQLAGINPIEVMQRLGARADLTHQNDLSKQTWFDTKQFLADLVKCEQDNSDIMPVYMKHLTADSFSDLGKGSFDFAGFYKKVNELGTIRCTIVENETTAGNKLIAVEKDYKFIESFI
jgi:sugar phosphate isomerase/epimerase